MTERPSLPAGVTAIIEALLRPGVEGREELLRQLPHTTVGRRCGCGCATVDLVVDRSAALPASVGNEVVASASFPVDGGIPAAGVLLFATDGYLSCLEVYSALDILITTWPDPRILDVDR
ncbi:hypothetical protein [Streptomyces sp. NPDC048612]|uniref:hypothetical protein n=1 Tax=Streptomyces sp. NPDC048612 TaxID=3365579 RepID=UPI0037165DC3